MDRHEQIVDEMRGVGFPADGRPDTELNGLGRQFRGSSLEVVLSPPVGKSQRLSYARNL